MRGVIGGVVQQLAQRFEMATWTPPGPRRHGHHQPLLRSARRAFREGAAAPPPPGHPSPWTRRSRDRRATKAPGHRRRLGRRPQFHVLATCLEHRASNGSTARSSNVRAAPGAAAQRPAGAHQRLPPVRRGPAEPSAGRAGGRRRRHPHPGAAHPPRRVSGQTPRPRRTGDAQLAAPRAPETRWMPVVPGGRYERQLAALPAGITAHGDAQVQVIVPHAPGDVPDRDEPVGAARRRLDGPHQRRARRGRTRRPWCS